MEKLLDFLRGKKTTIASIIGLVVVFSVNRGYIAQDVSELIMGILTILGLSVNYVDYQRHK
jgi:hypothetical protein